MTKKEEQYEMRKWQILSIALNHFIQYGFHGTSTRKIAEEAGISSGLMFHYFSNKLALYEALTDKLKKAVPEFTVRAQKSQISFYNRRLFAMVSLPRRKTESGIVVSFGLGYRLDSPRVAFAAEPYPGRRTHHVPVTDAAQLDDELLGWLREAYEFAANKTR